jgi:hypothetical protein
VCPSDRVALSSSWAWLGGGWFLDRGTPGARTGWTGRSFVSVLATPFTSFDWAGALATCRTDWIADACLLAGVLTLTSWNDLLGCSLVSDPVAFTVSLGWSCCPSLGSLHAVSTFLRALLCTWCTFRQRDSTFGGRLCRSRLSVAHVV